jgi:Ca-activated chloride channel homolog
MEVNKKVVHFIYQNQRRTIQVQIVARCLALLFSLSLLTGSLFAQTVQVTLVDTRSTVTDRSGQLVTNLEREDFTIFDNGIQQEIGGFGKKLQSPLSVALVVDRSESVSDRFQFVPEAAAGFIKSTMRKQEDRGLVAAFDSKVYLLQDWTADPELLIDSVRMLTTAGGTSLFDAVYKTSRDKFKTDDSRKKVMVLITDGEDTTSRATFKQVLDMAQLSGVSIYVIGIKSEGSLNARELQGKRILTELAELTGGRVFQPEDHRNEKLTALFARLEGELRNEYNISYYLDAPLDNTFHKIRIETKDRRLIVHGSKGFYARRRTDLP